MEAIFVIYHSNRWAELVEQGWVTHSIENNLAMMVKGFDKRRPMI